MIRVGGSLSVFCFFLPNFDKAQFARLVTSKMCRCQKKKIGKEVVWRDVVKGSTTDRPIFIYLLRLPGIALEALLQERL